jgi:RNA polymerase sigma-70 factor (ECF subfamily)
MVAGLIAESYRRLEQVEPVADLPMTELKHDVELVRRIAAKEDQALRELYAAYGQRMYAYALRLTQNPAQAEDVVQDALVAAWRSADRFRGEGRVVAWLLGIVHHIALKAIRHESQPISEAMEETMAASEPLPEERLQTDEQAQWVRRGLQSLSPNHRAVLELVFYQGLSLNEVARVCKCPVGTVKSRLSYARQHLRGVLSRGPRAEDWR